MYSRALIAMADLFLSLISRANVKLTLKSVALPLSSLHVWSFYLQPSSSTICIQNTIRNWAPTFRTSRWKTKLTWRSRASESRMQLRTTTRQSDLKTIQGTQSLSSASGARRMAWNLVVNLMRTSVLRKTMLSFIQLKRVQLAYFRKLRLIQIEVSFALTGTKLRHMSFKETKLTITTSE